MGGVTLKIKKSTLDELMGYTRKVWDIEDPDSSNIVGYRIDRAIELCQTEKIDWSPLLNLLDAVLMCDGFAPDACDDVVYAVIRLLGWEVVDDGEEHSASE
jgi:hypothetical protein